MTTSSDQVISLFSGAGGLSKGFALGGCKPVAGVEIDKDARATYEANLGVPCHRLDLGKVTSGELRSKIGVNGEPFAIIGGPPCQGFSSAGARGLNDPRNRLIFNYLYIVGELRPRWFLFENVEGLLTTHGGRGVYELAREFIGLGYWIRIEKVNFAGFGVPQARKRVIVIGNRLGLDFTFPEYSHSYDAGKHRWGGSLPPSPSIASALAGLGKAATSPRESVAYSTTTAANDYDSRMRHGNEAGAVTLHYVIGMSPQDVERISHLKPGQTMKDLPHHLWHDSYRRRAFRRVMDGTPTERRGGAPAGLKRLRAKLNSLTITGAATQEFVHPDMDRTLTLRECARIQSFEDAFQFCGSARSVAQQIGNAVPPMAGEVFAQRIKSLDGTVGAGKVVPLRSGKPTLLGFHLTNASGMSPALVQTQSLLASLMDELGLFQLEEAPLAARQAT